MDSNILIPQFTIGDVVYKVAYSKKPQKLDCPDCLGQQRWAVVSPAGQAYDFACPRCAQRNTDPKESLTYYIYEPEEPMRLTIGSVRIDTARKEEDRVEYMAEETGVGSGSVYKQGDLYWTSDDAFEAGRIKADTLNEESPDIKTAFVKRVELASFQLHEVRES